MNAAIGRLDLSEHCRDRLGVADVDDRAAGAEAALPKRGHEAVDLVGLAPRDDDMRAKSREEPTYRPADAAGPARHKRDLTGEQARRIDGGVDGQGGIVEAEALADVGFGSGVSHAQASPSRV